MGTNYYVVYNRPSIDTGWHIGKSSAGWLFSFRVQHDMWSDPPVVWRNYDELKEWLRKYTVEQTNFVIIDEYDEVISYDDFIKMVDNKQNDPHCRDNPDNFRWSRNVNGYRFDDIDFC